ncbi:MAG: phosphoribosylaminoimidazolesuccinocarboxamide synthase [Armatimonadaceae bacterium]
MANSVVLTTDIPNLPRLTVGKVRDVYAVGADSLLLIATDRISAFDVVMAQGIPDKGRVLTALSVFWFERTGHLIPNHLLSADSEVIAARLAQEGVAVTDSLRAMLAGRAMLCRRTQPLPIEAVVRGYISGSAWKAYCSAPVTGDAVDLWGVHLPAGLRESGKLPEPVFTPSTKAKAGHDEPMPRAEIADYIGVYAEPVERAALELYQFAADYAAERGILLADTKFEFGTLPDGSLILIDEALTPDSSRYWPVDQYQPGGAQPSFDKQFVRDFLETLPGWNKQPPPPDLPPDIIEKTAEKYREAYRRLTGQEFLPTDV